MKLFKKNDGNRVLLYGARVASIILSLLTLYFVIRTNIEFSFFSIGSIVVVCLFGKFIWTDSMIDALTQIKLDLSIDQRKLSIQEKGIVRTEIYYENIDKIVMNSKKEDFIEMTIIKSNGDELIYFMYSNMSLNVLSSSLALSKDKKKAIGAFKGSSLTSEKLDWL